MAVRKGSTGVAASMVPLRSMSGICGSCASMMVTPLGLTPAFSIHLRKNTSITLLRPETATFLPRRSAGFSNFRSLRKVRLMVGRSLMWRAAPAISTRSSPPSTACNREGMVVTPICMLPETSAGGTLVMIGTRVTVASILFFSKKPFSFAT